MTMLMFWSIIGAILCASIAGFKGRSVVGWLFIGLLSGLLGVIVIACIPALPTKATTAARRLIV